MYDIQKCTKNNTDINQRWNLFTYNQIKKEVSSTEKYQSNSLYLHGGIYLRTPTPSGHNSLLKHNTYLFMYS